MKRLLLILILLLSTTGTVQAQEYGEGPGFTQPVSLPRTGDGTTVAKEFCQ